MAVKYVFSLPKTEKNRNQIINNRYKFVDGEMVIHNQQDADSIARILCPYYACTMKMVQEADAAPAGDSETTLAASATKTDAPAAPAEPAAGAADKDKK